MIKENGNNIVVCYHQKTKSKYIEISQFEKLKSNEVAGMNKVVV